MATVTFLGHAGLAIEGAQFRLLCDPWLDPRGAYMGSWHQYPRNDHLDLASLLDVEYVAISHEHVDHFDPWFLSQLSERTRVIIPKYPSEQFRLRVLECGVKNVIEVAAWEQFPLDNAGSFITAIPEVSPMCHDAAYLIVADGHSVLNCNDARLTAAQARRAKHMAGGKLDFMGVQASGAAWHPMCYQYTPEEMDRIAREKKISKLRAVQRLVRATGPELAGPFAGPPCFLDPDVRHLNWVLDRMSGAYCDPEEAAEWLAEHLPDQKWGVYKPGDRLDLATGAVVRDPVSAKHDFVERRDEYILEYYASRAELIDDVKASFPEPGPDFAERFTTYFERLGSLSPYFNRNIDMTVRFNITGPNGGSWDVAFLPAGVTVGPPTSDKPGYVITTAGRWLLPIFVNRHNWEDLLISMRLSLYRDPDVYNDYLIGLLKHAFPSALQAVEEYETQRDESARVVVESEGRSYEIGRYCPHAGEDLAVGAVVEDGKIVCLGHNFTFDLKTGECVNARSVALPTRDVTGEVVGAS